METRKGEGNSQISGYEQKGKTFVPIEQHVHKIIDNWLSLRLLSLCKHKIVVVCCLVKVQVNFTYLHVHTYTVMITYVMTKFILMQSILISAADFMDLLIFCPSLSLIVLLLLSFCF